jgi:hypothetical protein
VTFASDVQAFGWREGIAKTSALAQRFTEQVAAGQVPVPLFPPLAVAPAGTVTYHSPQKLLITSPTVLSALQLTERLAQAALACSSSTCPTCGADISLFESLLHLLSRVAEEWLDQPVSLNLVGASARIKEWAASKGFTYSQVTEQQGCAHLDSFTVSREKLLSLADLLQSIIVRRDIALVAHTPTKRAMYALQGACVRCESILTGTTKAELTRSLTLGAKLPAELAQRQICATTLDAFINSPFSTMHQIDPGQQIASAALISMLHDLDLGALTYNTRIASLSGRAITKLALIEMLLQPDADSGLRILDAPQRLFSCDELQKVFDRELKGVAHRAMFVVLGAAPHNHATKSCPLHTVVTHDPLSVTPPSRGAIKVAVPQHMHHINTAQLLYDKLSQAIPRSNRTHNQQQEPLQSATYVPLFPRSHAATSIVATALGLTEPLATLYSRSQQALMLGLSSKQFLISSSLRGSGGVCTRCSGAGLTMCEVPGFTLPETAPCPLCAGTRYQTPLTTITFKGTTLWQLLNGTIREALPVLKALPKKTITLKIIEALTLLDIPLGLPMRLLSPGEHRLLLIAQGILRGTPSRPALVVVEGAFAGFDLQQHSALVKLISGELSTLLPHAAVVLVDS